MQGKVPEAQFAEARNCAEELTSMATIDRAVYEAYRRCRERLEQLRDEGLRAYSVAWEAFLNEPKALSPILARWTNDLWRRIRADLWAPTAIPRESSVLLIWDRSRHHLEIEIYENQAFDWLYRDRLNNAFTGGEDIPCGRIPSPLRAAIRKTGKGLLGQV
jgi:hypothetical protein